MLGQDCSKAYKRPEQDQQADHNLTRFNNSKCKAVLPCRPGAERLEGSFERQELGVLVENVLSHVPTIHLAVFARVQPAG